MDWVVICLDDTLHFAQLELEMRSDLTHPLNLSSGPATSELFKYRRVTEWKAFRLSRLPDAYRLVAAAGRGNVHQFNRTRALVALLAKVKDETEALGKFREMSGREWLQVLGPSSWESLCLAYRILTEKFVPTGLLIGGTLAVFDIVGRNAEGLHILGQCKKDPYLDGWSRTKPDGGT